MSCMVSPEGYDTGDITLVSAEKVVVLTRMKTLLGGEKKQTWW